MAQAEAEQRARATMEQRRAWPATTRACRASCRAASSSAWRWRARWCCEPSVLLFDEPLSNLDARLRRSMREEIRALQQRLGLTVAYVTHDQSEALAVSDQIIVMDAGRIAQAGTPQQLYEHPRSEFVAGFMGEAMLFDGQALADGTVQLGPLRVQPRQPVAAGCGEGGGAARGLAAERRPGRPGAPGLPGTVQKCAYLGSVQELTLDTALGSIFVVSPELEQPWQLGRAVWLSLAGHGLSVVAA